MNLTGRKFQNKSGKICVVKDCNENETLFEDNTKVATRYLLDKKFFLEIPSQQQNFPSQQQNFPRQQNSIDPSQFFNNTTSLFEQSIFNQINSLPNELVSQLPIDGYARTNNTYIPQDNASAVMQADPELEKEELARKYGLANTVVNSPYNQINEQNAKFKALLGEDQDLPPSYDTGQRQQAPQQPQPQQPRNQPFPSIAESGRATTVQIDPVMNGAPSYNTYIDPIVEMFRKTKRNTPFKVNFTFDKKIPRLDTIEMLEDSYETSIIDYLADEFVNSIIENPDLLKIKIVTELKAMLEKKVVKESKEQKKVEIKKTPEKVEEPVKPKSQGRKVTPKKNVELLPDIKSMIDSLTDNSKIAELLKNKEEK